MSEPTLSRTFIETSKFPSPWPSRPDTELPLIETLPLDIQISIRRYVRLPDRQMSLASALLKYFFIHRSAGIPWDEVVISRTPDPHRRPYWSPETAPSLQRRNGDRQGKQMELEFNVSHQAGLVGLVGCVFEKPTSTTTGSALEAAKTEHKRQQDIEISSRRTNAITPSQMADTKSSSIPRLGIDITCTNEPGRGPHSDLKTMPQLDEWIDIFKDVFSPADIRHMKHAPLTPALPASSVNLDRKVLARKLRRFYTFFALKEAYVKMTGEALLADWLREVEFHEVVIPGEAARDGQWAEQIERGTEVWFRGKKLEGLDTEIRGLGRGFIVSVIGDGVNQDNSLPGALFNHDQWKILDWKRDIEPCARRECHCLAVPGDFKG